jgi:hypothetical protein
MKGGKRRAKRYSAGICGEAYHLLPSSSMAQTPEVVAMFAPWLYLALTPLSPGGKGYIKVSPRPRNSGIGKWPVMAYNGLSTSPSPGRRSR